MTVDQRIKVLQIRILVKAAPVVVPMVKALREIRKRLL
jgi:hypothetical protein